MRTTLAVDEDIAKSFADIVKKKNMVIFSVTNDAIKLTTELLKEDIEPEEMLFFIKLVRLMDAIDVVPIPGYLNEEILNKLYYIEKDKLYEIFVKTGKEVSSVFKALMPNITNVLSFAKSLVKFFPLKKIEVEEKGGKIRLLVVGAGKSLVTTNCVLHFLRGFLEGYKTKIVEETVGIGIIDITFTPLQNYNY